MLWNMVSVWIIGALCLARGLNCLNLMDFLLAAFAMTAGIVLLVKYRKARKENRTAGEAVPLLTVILSWVCCAAFSFRALDTRRLTDYLFAAFFLTDASWNLFYTGRIEIIKRRRIQMVKHIVLYTLKEGVDKTEAVKLIASVLEPLVGKIPGLLHLEIRQAFNGMDYALYSEFESREALENYAVHPLHQEAKTHFFHLLDSRVAADYEA